MEMIIAVLTPVAILGWFPAWRLRRQVRHLAEQEERSRAYARMSSDWYWEQDAQLRFTWLSGGVFDKAGISPERFYGHTRQEMLAEGMSEETAALFAEHQRILDERLPFQDFDYPIVNASGEISHVSVSGEPFFDQQGQFLGYRGTGKDVTERHRIQSAMRQMAQYDGLTTLPNRKLFHDRLGQAIDLASRDGTSLALLYFDLDRFKPVNDRWGHEAGDLLLKEVAKRVLAIVRKSDTVARVGGDEFVILLQGVGLRENAGWIAAEVREALAYPFALAGVPEDIHIGTSLGITYYPDDALNGDELVRMADSGMYSDKARQQAGNAARPSPAAEAHQGAGRRPRCLGECVFTNPGSVESGPDSGLAVRRPSPAMAESSGGRTGDG